MPIDLSLPNIFKIISISGSFILSAFLVMLSISNSDMKGIIYIASLFTLIIVYFICFSTFGEKLPDPDTLTMDPICRIINIPGSSFSNSSINSAILSFIFIYLAVPMFYNSMNYSILTVVLVFYVIDCITMLNSGCTNMYAIVLSSLIGAGMAVLSTSVLMANKPSFLFYNAPANAEICSRPSNQKFKCNVYKNGEILQ
jgi:hypothetical protein